MIDYLPKFMMMCTHPTYHDSEPVTLLEMVGHQQGKINELVKAYNEFVEVVNTKTEEFINGTNTDMETFRVGIRQEFQDFIDVVALQIGEQNKAFNEFKIVVNGSMEAFTQAVESKIAKQNSEIKNVYDHVVENLSTVINEMLTDGSVQIGVEYNSSTEELTIIAGN